MQLHPPQDKPCSHQYLHRQFRISRCTKSQNMEYANAINGSASVNYCVIVIAPPEQATANLRGRCKCNNHHSSLNTWPTLISPRKQCIVSYYQVDLRRNPCDRKLVIKKLDIKCHPKQIGRSRQRAASSPVRKKGKQLAK